MSLTSESVAAGHPDKVADQISDAVLDAALRINRHAKVACEVLVAYDSIHIAGEIGGVVDLPYKNIAYNVIREIGYTDWNPDVICNMHDQSTNIEHTVASGSAGDQGIVYGYATTETARLMPSAVVRAHAIIRYLADARYWQLPIGPDGKAQVTIGGGNDNAFVSIHTHCDDHSWLSDQVLPIIQSIVHHRNVRLSFFSVGGPAADTGLTGRKLQVDTYGGAAPHGGGAFSGKDPTKMDRTGAYLARYIAIAVLREFSLDWAEIGIAYGFGLEQPLWLRVLGSRPETHMMERWVRSEFDLTPNGAIELLDLRRPIYQQTATYGHFGRPEFPWERAR
jgi:S-adenosylmethionine synthetase